MLTRVIQSDETGLEHILQKTASLDKESACAIVSKFTSNTLPGERISSLREGLSMSRQDLVSRIRSHASKEIKISESIIESWEENLTFPATYEASCLAKSLGVEIEDIFPSSQSPSDIVKDFKCDVSLGRRITILRVNRLLTKEKLAEELNKYQREHNIKPAPYIHKSLIGQLERGNIDSQYIGLIANYFEIDPQYLSSEDTLHFKSEACQGTSPLPISISDSLTKELAQLRGILTTISRDNISEGGNRIDFAKGNAFEQLVGVYLSLFVCDLVPQGRLILNNEKFKKADFCSSDKNKIYEVKWFNLSELEEVISNYMLCILNGRNYTSLSTAETSCDPNPQDDNRHIYINKDTSVEVIVARKESDFKSPFSKAKYVSLEEKIKEDTGKVEEDLNIFLDCVKAIEDACNLLDERGVELLENWEQFLFQLWSSDFSTSERLGILRETYKNFFKSHKVIESMLSDKKVPHGLFYYHVGFGEEKKVEVGKPKFDEHDCTNSKSPTSDTLERWMLEDPTSFKNYIISLLDEREKTATRRIKSSEKELEIIRETRLAILNLFQKENL